MFHQVGKNRGVLGTRRIPERRP